MDGKNVTLISTTKSELSVIRRYVDLIELITITSPPAKLLLLTLSVYLKSETGDRRLQAKDSPLCKLVFTFFNHSF